MTGAIAFQPLRSRGAWQPTRRPPEPPPLPIPVAEAEAHATVQPPAVPIEVQLAAAREEGRLEAVAALAADRQAAQVALDDARLLLSQVERTRTALLRAAAHDVAAIVRRFTERVVGGVLGEDPNALARVATEALERLPERDGVRICVPVGRGDALRGALGEPWAGAVVESASVHLGVVVQTDAVAVDASLSAVMDGLDAGVASWLGEAPWTSR